MKRRNFLKNTSLAALLGFAVPQIAYSKENIQGDNRTEIQKLKDADFQLKEYEGEVYNLRVNNIHTYFSRDNSAKPVKRFQVSDDSIQKVEFPQGTYGILLKPMTDDAVMTLIFKEVKGKMVKVGSNMSSGVKSRFILTPEGISINIEKA